MIARSSAIIRAARDNAIAVRLRKFVAIYGVLKS
jgi:hypothetical protein